uniref:Membrane-bound transcription factor site-2 protease n=1 Tax=Oryzias melastigma TaxID=30732 RepID=A0A3B3B4S0_ORYME
MIPVPLLVCVLAGWCVVYLTDTLLRVSRCSHPEHERRTEAPPTQDCCQWTPEHAMLARLAAPSRIVSVNPFLLCVCRFSSGLVFGVGAMLGSVVLLVRTLQQTYAQMTTDNPRMGTQQALQVVVPGVNLPTSQLVYFFTALLLSGVVHELGHAVAALREQVRVNGFGVFLFVLYPGAFVDLFTTHLNLVSPAQQLRIFCAGVWHNFVLCVAALAFLFLMPVFLFPLYSTGGGALVTEVVQVGAAAGLQAVCSQQPGETVAGTHNKLTINSLQIAFKRLDGTMDCCSNSSLTDLCFSFSGADSSREYACIPVRKMVTGTRVCRSDSDCASRSGAASVCVTPSLENQTRFIRVTHPPNTHMLFVGYLPHLQHAVSLTNFIPRFSFLLFDVPVFLETFCKYVVSLSGALAVVNSVPCFALDGQWMLNALLEATLVTVVTDRQKRELLGFFVLLAGSALLAANVALGLWMVTAR